MTTPNKRDSIIIEGTAYDITNFKHPGGNIINYAKNVKVGKKQTLSILYRKYLQIARYRPHPNSYLFALR